MEECCEPSLRSSRRTLKSAVRRSRSSSDPLDRSEGKVSSLMDANVTEQVNFCGPPMTMSAAKLESSAKESDRRAYLGRSNELWTSSADTDLRWSFSTAVTFFSFRICVYDVFKSVSCVSPILASKKKAYTVE